MYDAGKIVPGIVIFLLLATLPVWWSLASGQEVRAPRLELPEGQPGCVEPAARMRAVHMELLDTWRDQVVRSGDRTFVTWDGRRYEKSLTGTCLGCHDDTTTFCDRCHDYVAVSPYCWQCHVARKGGGR